MGNALYDPGRQNFLEADIDWLVDNIKVTSIDEDDDVPDLANDEFLSDILAGAREFQSANFASKTSTSGVADAADLLPAFALAAGDEFESISLYFDTTVAATSLLICNIDTATGLPLTPDGSNVDILWSNAPNKIYKI